LRMIVPPLLLMISTPNSLRLGFVKAPSDTLLQIGSVGPVGVTVEVIGVNVKVGVTGVLVGVTGVKVKVLVGVTGVKVLVGVLVFVGPGVLVLVGVTMVVGFGEEVPEGSINNVLVAGMVADGINVRDGMSVNVGVDVI